MTLLYFGGSFQRIEEQAKSGELMTAPDSVTQRKRRPMLLERLLEEREWMIQTNYGGGGGGQGTAQVVANNTHDEFTNLTKMLMTIAPTDKSTMSKDYEANYIKAYKRCQDKPGGPILGGRPNHRFEAYARAYAGCGSHTSLTYRWSYARMYESMAGASHESDERYTSLYKERPHDIIGKTCRLEPLLASRHSKELWEITSGNACNEHKAYNSDEVWGFLDCGPFPNPQSMSESEVFHLEHNSAGFAIVEFVTDRLIGVVHLSKDDPKNLSVQLDLPIVKPSSDGSIEQLEACFLLLDRLFAHGYRRIQICVDTLDVRGKRLPQRLGFTQEGQIPKHMIVKEANRDSIIYGMLNSDWDKGARSFLLKKLHGAAFEKADAANVAKEEAAEDQEQKLREKKEAEAKANKNK